MFSHSQKFASAVSVLFLLVLGILFFFDVLFLGKTFFAGDNLTINLPSKVLFWQMLSRGQLPLWNPFTFSGSPYLADINLGLLSPFTLFYLFLPPLQALTASIVTAVIVMGISMYFFARTIKLSVWASLIAAIVFMFSGSVMTHTMNTAILNSILWLPLLLIALEKLIRTEQIKYTLYASIILALILFGGHIQYFYYIVIFMVSYIFSRPVGISKKIVYASYTVIPSLFLSAIQLVPFLEYSQFSTRPVQDLSYAAGAAPFVSFIHLIIPNFFGVMKDGTSWGATADINGYVGIIPLILSLLAALRMRNRYVKFFGIAAFISLLLALGRYSPLYLAAFYILPFFSRFRSPASVLIIYTLCLSVLSGYGIEYFFTAVKKEGGKLAKLIPFGILSSLLLAGFSIYLKLTSNRLYLSIIQTVHRFKETAFTTRFLEYSAGRMNIIFSLWTNNIVALALTTLSFLLLAYVLKRQKNISFFQKSILVLLIATDLLLYASNNYITANAKLLTIPDKTARFFASDRSIFRVLTMMDPGAKPPFGNPEYFSYEAIKALDFIQPNTNILLNKEIIGGYASVVHASYSAYLSPSQNSDPTSITLPVPGMGQLDELGVKYIITAGRYDHELSKNFQYKKVYEYTDPRIKRTFKIYENTASYPRAFVLNGNGERIGKALITYYSPNEISLYVNTPQNGRLVLTNLYYPGWRAYENGRLLTMKEYKIFQSVSVSAGETSLLFRYEPRSFYIGAAISAVNWIYVLGFLVYVSIKKHQKVSQKLHIAKPEIKQDS